MKFNPNQRGTMPFAYVRCFRLLFTEIESKLLMPMLRHKSNL